LSTRAWIEHGTPGPLKKASNPSSLQLVTSTRVDGAYEIFFDPKAEPGRREVEGAKILAFQPRKMLSITWNAPPELSEVRKHWTHVTVRFEEIQEGQTKKTLTRDGWGEAEEWDEAFAYFSKAWIDVVLPRLKYRFAVGPVDWDNPPN
jgi:uncharacterized protein YndB with AHSA1/START domain